VQKFRRRTIVSRQVWIAGFLLPHGNDIDGQREHRRALDDLDQPFRGEIRQQEAEHKR
jgi:hypothetical protein